MVRAAQARHPYIVPDHTVDQLLSVDMARELVESAFRQCWRGEALNEVRNRVEFEGVVLNTMSAIAPRIGVAGSKSYPVLNRDVTQGAAFAMVVYAVPGGQIAGVLEAGSLSARRTGAASAVATAALARPDSRVLTIIGAGWQAWSQLEALTAVLPGLEQVNVVSRTAASAARFASAAEERLGVPVAVSSAEVAVRAADVVVTATGSSEPVLQGAWLRPGTHVNAIGSNYASKRELDRVTLERASVVAVDSVPVALLECGDLIRNRFDFGLAVELGAILGGARAGRTAPGEITLFESQGLAVQDLFCAARVLDLLAGT